MQQLCQDYLRERGITDETVQKYGIEFDDRVSQKVAKERLGMHLPEGTLETLWFPLYDKEGKNISWIARPLPTIPDKKFLCALGSSGPPFIPKDVYGLAYGHWLIITESPIKALAIIQAGFYAIGLSGVWGGGAKNSQDKSNLRSDLYQALDWTGRKVAMAFDADSAINPKVRHALIRLFFLLWAAGAEVYQLTSWDLTEAKGIDDFLVSQFQSNGQHKPEDVLAKLLKEAKPFVETLEAKSARDLAFCCAELAEVQLHPTLRAQLTKALARALDVPLRALEDMGPKQSKPVPSFAENTEPWEEPIDPEELFNEVMVQIRKEAIIELHQLWVAALEVFLTWVHEKMDYSPILYITGPTRECGKTRLLGAIGKMARRPLKSSSITAASLFRLSELYKPTVLVDEAQDAVKNEDFCTVLKAGHDPTDLAVRCAPTTNQPETFDVFCPKILAGIGRANGQIMSRSITIEMERSPGEVESGRKRTDPPFVEIRRKLARWAADVGELRRFHLPRESAKMRQKDNWEVYYRVACGISVEVARQLLKYIPSFIDEEQDFDTYLFSSLRALFRAKNVMEKGGHLGTETILEALNQDKEAPWFAERHGKEGKGLSPEKLSRRLRNYKVRPKQHRHSEEVVLRGYFYIDPDPKPRERSLKDVFDEYLPGLA